MFGPIAAAAIMEKRKRGRPRKVRPEMLELKKSEEVPPEKKDHSQPEKKEVQPEKKDHGQAEKKEVQPDKKDDVHPEKKDDGQPEKKEVPPEKKEVPPEKIEEVQPEKIEEVQPENKEDSDGSTTEWEIQVPPEEEVGPPPTVLFPENRTKEAAKQLLLEKMGGFIPKKVNNPVDVNVNINKVPPLVLKKKKREREDPPSEPAEKRKKLDKAGSYKPIVMKQVKEGSLPSEPAEKQKNLDKAESYKAAVMKQVEQGNLVLPLQPRKLILLNLCGKCADKTNQQIKIEQAGAQHFNMDMCKNCVRKNLAISKALI